LSQLRVEAVRVHDLGPRRYEVAHELLGQGLILQPGDLSPELLDTALKQLESADALD
jgi:hypothetical protein